MKYCSRWNHRAHHLFLLGCAWMLFQGGNHAIIASEIPSIGRARKLFYQSVEQADSIEKAIRLFKEIQTKKADEGIALTYIGALTALKGKFAFLPVTKYRRVLQGLALMDRGVKTSPDDIEARFIRGMTCFYLPFFFNRKQTAREDFRHIVRRLNTEFDHYNTDMIMNVTDFLLEHAELNTEEMLRIEQIQNRIRENDN